MADSSENPQDNARLNDLERTLRGTVDDLSAELRQAQDLAAQARADQQRATTDRTAARKEASARGARSPRPAGAAAEGTPVDEIRAQSDALNQQTAAERRLGEAQRDRAKATREAAQSVRSARADEYLRNAGLGGPAPGRAAPGPAAAAAAEVESRVAAAAAPPPPRPTGPTPQQVQQAANSAARLAEAEDAHLQSALRAVPATKELSGALAEQTRALGLADNAYTRHGYLTSEFISAAARGEVTFAEMGNQVTGTIAKFAGWTAAAASVYGVVGALHELYTGAIQSASGVGLVNRVTTQQLAGGNGALQQQFRDLARQFNLPMEDVVQATYGAAKAVGGDLPQALQVAQQALFGVKVGELSAADSTRYLQGIMRGFGASASELPDIFDAINQAQNRFGGSTGDMIAGVAKAAGTFKLAGGSYRELIALITTGTKIGGSTATEVATAISRSASRVLTPQGADALRGVGLDPNQQYTAILAQAMKKAQNSSPQEVNQLARALVPAGGQFARIFNPLLQNRKLYDQVFAQLDPSKAKGSASRELSKALSQPDEQLKRLIVDLERLGSSLAQAGGLNLLVGIVKGLDTALDLTVKLVDAFNLLPNPLRQTLAPLLEISLLLRAARRFDVGASLPTGQQGSFYGRFRENLRRPTDSRNSAQITQGLGDEQRFYEENRRRVAQQAASATYQAERAATRRDSAQETFHAAPLGSAARSQARDQLVAAESVYQARLHDSQRLVADQVDYAERTVVIQRQITEYERLRKAGLTAEAAAAQAGIGFTNPTLNRPVPMQPIPIGASRSGGGVIIPGGTRAVEQAAAEAAGVDSKLKELATAGAATSVAGRALGSTSRAAGSSLRAARDGIGAGISGLRSLGATTIGGLDAAFIGIPAAIAIWGQVQDQIKEREATLARLGNTAGGPEGIRARVDQYRVENRATPPPPALSGSQYGPLINAGLHPRQTLRSAQDTFADVGNALIPGGAPLVSTKDTEDAAAKQAESFAQNLAEAQKKNALLYVPQIQANFKRALATAQTPQEVQQALDQGISQLDHGYANAFGDKNARAAAARVKDEFRAQIAQLAASRGDLSEAQKQVTDLASLKVFTGRVQTSFGLQGGTTGNLRAAAFGIQAAREQIGADPTKAADALSQLNSLQSAVQQQVNDTMNRLLPLAKSPAEAGQVRTQAIEQLRTGLTSGLQARASELSSSIVATQDAITRTQADIASGQGGPGAQAALSGLQGRLRSRQNRYKQLAEGLKQEDGVISTFEAEQKAAQFELEQSVYDATTTTKAGAINNPVAALQFQLRRNRSRLDDIAKQYGKESTQYQQAIQQEQQLQDQIVTAEITRAQTAAQIKAGGTADPVVQARIQLDAVNKSLANLAARGRQQTDEYSQLILQKQQEQQQLIQAQVTSFQGTQALNRARSNIGATQSTQLQGALTDAQNFVGYLGALPSGQVSPDQMNQALTAVAQAQGALADYVRQQAQALISAKAELAKSQTSDPVKQAEIDLRAAQDAVKFAQTPAERASALAAVNNAKTNVVSTKLQSKEDDIDFERQMDKISVSTAIDRYEALLKMKNLTKAERRNILTKIKGLQDDTSGDSDFNIDPNSIRLPTPYEVFRAVKEGANARTAQNLKGAVQNSNHIVINVADQDDVQKVADVLDQYLDTSAASSLRAMGISG